MTKNLMRKVYFLPLTLSPDKEENKRSNFTPQAFESVIFGRFYCERKVCPII